MSHEQTSDSETPQKMKKRHVAQTSYRTFRRKAKTPVSSTSNTDTRAAGKLSGKILFTFVFFKINSILDKSDSSSDEENDQNDDFNSNIPSTSTSGTYLAMQNDVPSTSTGITANGKGYPFRVASASDSDDDQSIPDTTPSNENLVRVIRSPVEQANGFLPHCPSDDDSYAHQPQRR